MHQYYGNNYKQKFNYIFSAKALKHTDKHGNRKLNRAVHSIALSPIGRYGSKSFKAYYRKKRIEGKSKLWALRCLKRQIINNIFTILTEEV